MPVWSLTRSGRRTNCARPRSNARSRTRPMCRSNANAIISRPAALARASMPGSVLGKLRRQRRRRWYVRCSRQVAIPPSTESAPQSIASPMKWNALAEQSSSLCKALSVIGDRWTLLILNQCFLKLRRYGEIHSSLGLSKPLLAARLKKMVRLGVLKKVPSRESARVHEYLLTEKGRQLYPVLLALVRWGNALLIEEARPSIRGHVPCGRRRG